VQELQNRRPWKQRENKPLRGCQTGNNGNSPVPDSVSDGLFLSRLTLVSDWHCDDFAQGTANNRGTAIEAGIGGESQASVRRRQPPSRFLDSLKAHAQNL